MPSKGILVCLLAVCLALLAFPSQVAAANPILVITSTSNPYTTFLPEILNTEGFNEFDSADISTVSSTTLTAYDLAILGDMTLTAAQASMFSTWVNAGGNLIAMHPDPQLAGLLGLADSGSALQNAYVLINTAGGPGVGLVGQTIQFHGPAELYVLNGATSYATLYSNASTPTSNPGVTLNLAGAGQAAAFSYDLARSVVYTRQGNPAWSGQARDAANTPPIRAYDLFFGAASFDPEPDWIDFNKIQIPQADEQQRLLANLILQMNGSKKPLPRFWYLPSGFKAAVIMTGDDHGSYYGGSATKNRFSDFVAASPSGCSVANWTCVRGTAYLFPKIIASNTLTNSQISSYISQGFEIGVHVDSATDCQDWTTTTLDTDYANYLASLASQYPSVPAPQTHRMHCVSWSDYDSQPTIELKHGIRLDTTYYYYPSTWINDLPGLFTGSGMPMRYADRNGNLINVYQATTQMTDESGQSYPQNINTLLDNALSGTAYYGVFTANMHNDQIDYPGPGAAAIVSSAQARGVPVITALQMLQWLDGRNGSSFTSLSWSGNVLSFSVTVGTNANNLRAMLPANFGSLGLTSMVRGSTAVSYQLQVIKGVQYAVFAATAGSYKATYGGPPLFSISGALIPGAVSSGATVAAIGPVTVTATADNYGNYFLNGLPSGTYQVTPSRAGINFTPATQTVTITGANVTAVNFDVVETCPCSLWNASSTPANPADADPSATELGVAFRSDVAGNITGIRFYKGSGNTGTHIGNLWTASGTNLATATFSGETASGWQQVNFATPVAIAANTIYIASYHTTTGYYSADAGYFSTSYDNAPLHAVQDGVGHSNGLYRYGASAFPNNTYASTNYWVDVVFSPTTTTFSLSGTVSGPGGGGATITLTGAASASTTADTSGNYSFTNLPNGTYTVTPGNSGFSFTPASQLVAIGNANATGVNFATATYTISGNVSGAGGSGATVSLSGPANATVTADASGNFSFTGLLNGAYTVTPSKTGFTFTPASLGASVNGANVTGLSFSTVTYSISGTISGPGGVNAVVNLSGAASAATTADASGNYSFTGLSNGSYTVMPSSSGVIFTPSSQPATIANGSVTGVNFSTPIPTYTLQGNISGPGGPGATVTLSGASSAATIADGSGNFTFNALIAGSYTITPSNSGFGFSPGPQTIAISNANVTGVSFSSVAAACPCSLWGSSTVPGTVSANDPYQVELGVRFTSDAAGFVTGIRFYKGSTNTGTHVGHLWSNTGTLLATATFSNETASGWQQVTFATPVAIVANTTYVASYNTTSGNYSYDQNYFTSAFNNPPLHGVQNGSTSGANGVYIYGTSAFPTGSYLSTNYYVDVVFVTTSGYGIAGTISGPGGSGATVSLTGASTATITADASGNFTFTGLANGAYTVTPTKAGYTFTPASQPVTVSNASVTGVAFSTVGYTISGTISGAGGNGATVNLTGTSTATVTADASGNFTFTGLANGAYTITPSKSGYAFTPASQPVTVSNANVTGISFSTVTYTISGTISGSGGNGATVNLTGTSTATVTADESKNNFELKLVPNASAGQAKKTDSQGGR